VLVCESVRIGVLISHACQTVCACLCVYVSVCVYVCVCVCVIATVEPLGAKQYTNVSRYIILSAKKQGHLHKQRAYGWLPARVLH
jgi:hypothetical protein